MIKKILLALLLFLSVAFSGDKIYYKISNINDIGILILYDDKGNAKVLSVTKNNDENTIKHLRNEYNYLVFILYDLPDISNKKYHPYIHPFRPFISIGVSIINAAKLMFSADNHYSFHYRLYLLPNNLVVNISDSNIANKKKYGIKKVIVHEIRKKDNMIQIFFKKKYSSLLQDSIEKKLKQYYKTDREYTRKQLEQIYMSNIFQVVNTSITPLLKKSLVKSIKKYEKSNNLKMLEKLKSNQFINRKNLRLSINKVKLYWSNNFYNALQTKNLKKAKDIINNGLSTTFDNQDTRSIYDIVEKISKIEKKYKVKISVDLKNPKDDISIIKDGFKIGKISQIGKTIKGVCPYKKEFLANNLTDISMKIITGCIKTGDDCTKERDINKCFIVKDYKLLGYIASITKDAKKSDYLWSLYSKNGTFIDEYDTYENQKNLLKRYNKYTDKE